MKKVFRIPVIFLFLIFISIAGSVWAEGDLKFVVLGDTRGGSAVSPVLKRMVPKINKYSPDFTIILGDFVNGTSNAKQQEKQFYAFKSVADKIKGTVYYLPGNHDINGSTSVKKLYVDMFGKSYYSFNKGDAHFIALDSEEPNHDGEIAGTQFDWLKHDLSENKDMKYKFVFVHRPFFPSGPHKGSSLDAHSKQRDAVFNLLEKYGVDIIFSAHEHLYHSAKHGTITEIITGGGGAPLYATPSKGGYYHFILVTVNNGIKTRVIK